jgi:hypothetical protein
MQVGIRPVELHIRAMDRALDQERPILFPPLQGRVDGAERRTGGEWRARGPSDTRGLCDARAPPVSGFAAATRPCRGGTKRVPGDLSTRSLPPTACRTGRKAGRPQTLKRAPFSRHCEQSEALHERRVQLLPLDCFAALAMTVAGKSKKQEFPVIASKAKQSTGV